MDCREVGHFGKRPQGELAKETEDWERISGVIGRACPKRAGLPGYIERRVARPSAGRS